MDAKDLLKCDPLIFQSNCAYVILDGNRGIIVPPGVIGKKITVRACDADGVPSGPVKKVSPKELRLPAPSTPSTPPPRAVVRELREPGDAPVHRVRIGYLWSRVRREAVEAAPTRVPSAAGGGVWGGVCEE